MTLRLHDYLDGTADFLHDLEAVLESGAVCSDKGSLPFAGYARAATPSTLK
jgi:hypothetical protein